MDSPHGWANVPFEKDNLPAVGQKGSLKSIFRLSGCLLCLLPPCGLSRRQHKQRRPFFQIGQRFHGAPASDVLADNGLRGPGQGDEVGGEIILMPPAPDFGVGGEGAAAFSG